MFGNKFKIVLVDYGLGNIFSIEQACLFNGYKVLISSLKEDIDNADALILPGMGAFGNAVEALHKLDIFNSIKQHSLNNKPLMGVCLGMQLLFDESEEFGIHKGLGIIEGKIIRFPEKTIDLVPLKIPHIGWAKLSMGKVSNWLNTPLCQNKNEDYFYFVHSYYAVPEDENNILGAGNYQGFSFCAAVQKKNTFGFQFHPEKSAHNGLHIYANFLKHIEKYYGKN